MGSGAVDPFSLEVLRDPLPFQHVLRETGPVVWLELPDDDHLFNAFGPVE